MTWSSCARRARHSRSGATTSSAWSRLGIVQRLHLCGCGLRPASASAERPAGWTTSARGASAQNPPSAPTGLAALAGTGSVSLSWTAPAFDGGSPITSYKVYRGTSAGTETFLANAGTSTSFVDTTAVNGTTYYYKVSAENANGEGPLSSEASATPQRRAACEPLPTVDDFNRANENPLSDANRWTNGVNGTTESRPASSRPRTPSRARSRRPVPLGATPPSTGLTSKCGRGSRPCPALTTTCACTRA